jgi:hypothetical protein
MAASSWSRLTTVLGLLVLMAAAVAPPAASEVIECATPQVAPEAPPPQNLYVYRPGTQNTHLRWRDVEFLVDSAYTNPLNTTEVTETLNNFGFNLGA